MFYRVTMLEKSDDQKEMIVRVDNKEAALALVDAAKSFLFPGEDSSEYVVYVSECHVDILEVSVPHWRIVVIRPNKELGEWGECETGSATMTIEAESPEEAIRLAKEDLKGPGEFYAKEISVEELIAEFEQELRHRIKEEYISAKHGDVSIMEFTRLMKNEYADGNRMAYYNMLGWFLGKTRLWKFLGRSIDLTKISAAEYYALTSKLPLIPDRDAFNAIFDEAKAKYGKA